MKKALQVVSVLCATMLLLTACVGLDLENMTESELLREAQKKDKFPAHRFHFPTNFGMEFEAGERWHQILTKSASNIAEASNEVAVFAAALNSEQDTFSYEIAFINENNFFFQFKLKYTLITPYQDYVSTWRVIVFKEDALTCKNNNQEGYVCEIRLLDKNSVKQLMDIQLYIAYHAQNVRFLHREITETSDFFNYIYYKTTIIYSDKAPQGRACLDRVICKISKDTGEIQYGEPARLQMALLPAN